MADLPASSTYSGVNMSYHLPQSGHIRRSLPNMAHSMLVHEPAKIYPYHLLLITNYRLPGDVDRCNLEVVVFVRYVIIYRFKFTKKCAAPSIRRRVRSDFAVQSFRILPNAAMAPQRDQTTRQTILRTMRVLRIQS